jgi:hypothetical protein
MITDPSWLPTYSYGHKILPELVSGIFRCLGYDADLEDRRDSVRHPLRV